MKIDIITIFPAMFEGPFKESIIARAQEEDKVNIDVHDLRQWTSDKHRTVDDKPYGGGPGMVMMIEPIDKALSELKQSNSHVIMLSAKGQRFTQPKARQLAQKDHLILICGHYEGVDQRVLDYLVDESISIGDYILTGGEIPAMVVTDAVVRLLPGVVGDQASLTEESHEEPGVIEYPQYTRPQKYKGWQVPDTLLSGNHQAIKDWRQENKKTID